jgi:hypothetical protein
LFDAALRDSEQQGQQQPPQQQSSGHHMNQDSNQTSGQSMQAKNMNGNAMDSTLTAVTLVQQIMTELSGAPIEQETAIIITKVVLRLLKNNDNSS